MFIFSKLPSEVIFYILSYNEYFKIKKGSISSIILPTDYRYNILNSIIIKPQILNNFFVFNRTDGIKNYNLYFLLNNLFNFKQREEQFIDDDKLHISINFDPSGFIKYNINIYRLKLKDSTIYRKPLFYKGNLLKYEWHYLMYSFVRY